MTRYIFVVLQIVSLNQAPWVSLQMKTICEEVLGDAPDTLLVPIKQDAPMVSHFLLLSDLTLMISAG